MALISLWLIFRPYQSLDNPTKSPAWAINHTISTEKRKKTVDDNSHLIKQVPLIERSKCNNCCEWLLHSCRLSLEGKNEAKLNGKNSCVCNKKKVIVLPTSYRDPFSNLSLLQHKIINALLKLSQTEQIIARKRERFVHSFFLSCHRKHATNPSTMCRSIKRTFLALQDHD